MAQDKVANEHYVPRAYLDAFANAKKQCNVFDKINGKFFVANVQKILSERYLYDFAKELIEVFPSVDEQAVEKILGMTIDRYWKNIARNIENNYEWFSLKYSWHFLDVYRCAAVQMIRTPKGKKNLLNIYNEVYGKSTDERFENIVFAKELFNILDDNMKSVLLEMLLNEYGHITVGINDTKIPFVTSDNPLFTMPYIWDEKKEERMLYYPVTPTRCLIFHKRNYVDSQLNEVLKEFSTGKFVINDLSDIMQEAYKREKEILRKLNPETRSLQIEDVLVLNTCCVGQAEQYIISNFNSQENRLWMDSYKDIEKVEYS